MNLKEIIPLKLKRFILLQLKKGNKYLCPFCQFESKELGFFGIDFPVIIENEIIGSGRRSCSCYSCGSTDRQRLVFIYLKYETQILKSPQNFKVLHIAPEPHLSHILYKLGFKEYVCGDLFTEGYTYPKFVQNMNILNIQYPDNYFDLIICNHVLEHIIDDHIAIKELSRVLKNSGQAILQVPISKKLNNTFEDRSVIRPEDREKIFGQADHVRIYGQDYSDRLEQNGFKVDRINIIEKYQKFGLNPLEDLFICSK
ncbi:class I SAM-dependent methyltransferase [Cyclobacteriaceae bacterium YHN15]|nr:class I SAM-dependent methyltransferase [Cyclobacteriaceae bacterium YHN15]